MSEQKVRVTYPGVEGQPLVRVSRVPALVARGWAVAESDSPSSTDENTETSTTDLVVSEQPDSRAESNNKEK